MTDQATLTFSAIFSLVSAFIYGYVGWRLGKREVTARYDRQAWQLFIIWWYGLAATTLITGFESLLGSVGFIDLPLFLTAFYINLLVTCITVFGLMYYLLYLFTGNSRTLLPLGIFYMMYYAVLVYAMTAGFPTGVSIDRWNVSLIFRIPREGPLVLAIVALLLVPQILGGLAYFTMYFRVKETTQKYRVLLVSWSIIIWFASPFITLGLDAPGQDWWQIIQRLIGLVAASTVLVAYLPPRWVRMRFDIAPLNVKTD